MYVDTKQFVRTLTASVLVALFAIPHSLFAQTAEHVVSPADLQKAVADVSRTREQNRETLNAFFSSEKAQKALKSARMDPQQVKVAVAGLSDADLAQLSSRANKAQADFAAGNISDRDLLIILVAVAALILIIVAVH